MNQSGRREGKRLPSAATYNTEHFRLWRKERGVKAPYIKNRISNERGILFDT